MCVFVKFLLQMRKSNLKRKYQVVVNKEYPEAAILFKIPEIGDKSEMEIALDQVFPSYKVDDPAILFQED